MKAKIIQIISPVILLLSFHSAQSQDTKNFPFDPFVILKSWNYDFLVKTMGNGEEVLGKMNNQSYLAGLRYPADLLGMHGKLEFSFTKDSISRFQFRKEHIVRVISADVAGHMTRDTTVSREYNRSIQKMDSLSRDSLVRAISEILGTPLSNGRTAATEKNARHSAVWINRGYSCLYKDYINYCEIVFAITTVPLWVVGEFGIPAGTEILRKFMVSTRKMSWTASLLGFPSNARSMLFSDVFLLLEFATGQRYLAVVPKNPFSYLLTPIVLEFATGQRFLLNVPKNSISYLPSMVFQDCDGDAIPEAWIQAPVNESGTQTRHILFSLPYKEPNLIFDSDDQIAYGISILNNSRIQATFQDGTTRSVEFTGAPSLPKSSIQLITKGFKYLNTNRLNTDGSTDFIGGIELSLSPKSTPVGILEITYKHSPGGWEAGQIKLLQANK